MMKSSWLKVLVLSPLISGVVLSFQNCSPVRFQSVELSSVTDLNLCAQNPQAPQCVENRTCTFNGQEYSQGDVIKAYLISSVPNGQNCTSEDRTCVNGEFSGSYVYATCAVNGPQACLFNGQTIAHGGSVRAYQNSAVPFGSICVLQDRTCSNGALSGSYNFAGCTVGGAASCLFNGQTINHGSSVMAYPNSSVPYGQSCQGVSRTCNNGVLSGSGSYASCTTGAASSCLFNGQTIAHGQTVKAYQNASVAFGSICQSQDRVCNNGSLSGSYNYSTCSVGTASSCLFNGQTLAHGQTVTAYTSSSVPFGQSCVSQSRTCSNGILSGSYTYASCSVGNAASCLFNGQTIANGQSVTAYQSSSVAYGSTCTSQTRTCSNGSLSGSYTYASCNAGAAASCNFNGQTVAHGQTVIAYASSSVAFGSTCSSQSRTCNNGILSGTYSYSICSAQSAANCTFNGQTVPNGSSITAYAASSVPFGQSCQSQQRTCNNGTLSGTYGASSCSVQGAASCSYPGGALAWGSGGVCTVSTGPVTLAHGQSISFSSAAASAKGNITYSCSNGTFQVVSESCNPIVLSLGQHCDIGGPWGWKATEAICPTGQKPVSAESLGGCPAGFTPYNANGVTGCYIGNSNPARPSSCTGDPKDECCMWMCAANQTSVVRWQCAFQLDVSGQRAYGRCTTNRRVSSRDESVISETTCASRYGSENCDPDTEIPYVPFEGGG